MKILLYALILAFSGSLSGQEVPTMIRVTTPALNKIIHLHGFLSDSGSKHISIQAITGIGATNNSKAGQALSYMLEFESLSVGGWDEAPQSEPISIRLGGLEFRTNQKVIERLRVSTIDIVQVISTDGEIDTVALILRPSDPISVTRYEKEEVEQASSGQPATRSELESEGDDKPQPEAEGHSR